MPAPVASPSGLPPSDVMDSQSILGSDQDQDQNDAASSHSSGPESERDTISAYACLDLVDGRYYMTSPCAEFGRKSEETTNVTRGPDTIQEMSERIRDGTFDPEETDDPQFIPIYCRAPGHHKSISRRHLRIQYNQYTYRFEVLFMGRNGGWLDSLFCSPGDYHALRSGSALQMGEAMMQFWLPNGDSPSASVSGEEDLESSETSRSESELRDASEEMEDAGDDSDAVSEDAPRTKSRKNQLSPTAGVKKIVRKGPGRPPKNGVMSKKEAAQRAKEAKSDAQKQIRKAKQVNGRGRGKTEKAVELEQSSTRPSGKRKYTKRKKTGDVKVEDGKAESSDQTDSVAPDRQRPKPQKIKRPPRSPRSPSPVFNIDEMTPEQLARPTQSYVVLIHEILTNSASGQMSLPQIYRAIERKYPFFKLKVTSVGWQSSVRHNLGQHPAFKKIEREGKGWKWGINPEVSIEKERKRKMSPPAPNSQPPRTYAGPSPAQHRPGIPTYPVPYPSAALPHTNGMPSTPYHHPNGYHGPTPSAQGNPPVLRPPYGPPAFPLILQPREGSYQSPYQRDSNATASTASAPPGAPQNNSMPPPPPPPVQAPAQSMQDKSVASPHQPVLNNMHHSNTSAPDRDRPSGITGPPGYFSEVPPNLQVAFNVFKREWLKESPDPVHTGELIDSAQDLVYKRSSKSRWTNERDINEEKTLHAGLEMIFNALRKAETDRNNTPHIPTLATPEKVVEDVVKQLPRPRAYKVPNGNASGNASGSTATNGPGSPNGLKHKRTDTAEQADQPEGKKR